MNTAEYPAAVICIHNEGNEVSLQLWKIYKPLRDHAARSEGFFRIVDESGEDYLFPEENFVPIELPMEVKRPFERALREQRRAAPTPRISGSVKRPSTGPRKEGEARYGESGLTSRIKVAEEAKGESKIDRQAFRSAAVDTNLVEHRQQLARFTAAAFASAGGFSMSVVTS